MNNLTIPQLRLAVKRYKRNPDFLNSLDEQTIWDMFHNLDKFMHPLGAIALQLGPPETHKDFQDLFKAVEELLINKDWKSKYVFSEQPEKGESKGFTKSRQVEAMLFIFDFLKVEGIDQTEKAKFIEFLTGKNYQNIYEQVLSNPNVKEPILSKKRKADLQFIRPYFDKLGLRGILVMIDNELDKPLEKNIK